MERARSFEWAAEAYERARPGYPEAAIAWMLGDRGTLRVLDLAAGTGKLTRQLVVGGHDVIAVEPAEGMSAQLAQLLPEVQVLDGSAEAIPLPDSSVDAVLVAQAWHWFDPERAPAEIARVLRPHGVLGIVWNLRDDSEPWVARLSEILYGGADSTWRLADEPPPDPGPLFDAVEERRFAHAAPTDAASLLDLVRSRSYFIVAPPAAQTEILTYVEELTASHPSLAGRAAFELPYVTLAFRARRRA